MEGSYIRSPFVPSVRPLSSDRHDFGEVQYIGSSIRTLSNTQLHERCNQCTSIQSCIYSPLTAPPGDDVHLSHPEGLRLRHHAQHPFHSLNTGGRAPESHVVSGSGNTARTEPAWRLRPVSELRASSGIHCSSSFYHQRLSQLTGSVGHSNSRFSM